MATVFPETMDPINLQDLPTAVGKMESYIRYMCERVEFAVTGVTRTAAKAGNAGALVVEEIGELKSDLSVLSSQLNRIQGTVNGLSSKVLELEQAQTTQSSKIQELEQAQDALTPQILGTPPAASTQGCVGQLAVVTNQDGAKVYICVGADAQSGQYTWLCLSGAE